MEKEDEIKNISEIEDEGISERKNNILAVVEMETSEGNKKIELTEEDFDLFIEQAIDEEDRQDWENLKRDFQESKRQRLYRESEECKRRNERIATMTFPFEEFRKGMEDLRARRIEEENYLDSLTPEQQTEYLIEKYKRVNESAEEEEWLTTKSIVPKSDEEV